MASRVRRLFEEMARKLDMDDEDLHRLQEAGIRCAGDFYFRMPSPAALEDFLEEAVMPNTATRDKLEDGTEVFVLANRFEGMDILPTARTWLRGAVAASMRRLWEACRTAAKHDVEALGEEADLPVKKKMSAPVMADLTAKAMARGLPALSSTEAPGPRCLQRVADNFRSGGPLQYLSWEGFTTAEDERLADLMKGSRSRRSVELKLTASSSGELRGVSDDVECTLPTIEDAMTLSEVLRVRAAAHATLDLISFAAYERLHLTYIRKLRKRQPMRFRGPTLGEIREVDRMLHEEVLKFLAQGSGEFAPGISWFVDEGASHAFMKLLDGQSESAPDFGAVLKKPRLTQQVASSAAELSLCWTCNKPRSAHASGRFCLLSTTEAFAPAGKGGKQQTKSKGTRNEKGGKYSYPQQERSGKGQSKKGGKGPSRKSDQGEPPPFLRGCALRTPPSTQHPAGRAVCFDYHNPDRRGCGGSCGRAHTCTKFGPEGAICGQAHAVFDH